MAKFCPTCGKPLQFENAEICPNCGVGIQGPQTESTTKKRSALEWIAIVCGGIILLVFLSAFIAGMFSGMSGDNYKYCSDNFPGTTYDPSSKMCEHYPTPTPTLSIEQIKSQARSISFASLMRNSDEYTNSLVYFRGSVVQVQNIDGNNYYLRINTKPDPYLGYMDDTIYVDYTGNRLLEDDIVDVWGRFVGLKSYTAVLGNEITLPEINALHVEMVKAKT